MSVEAHRASSPITADVAVVGAGVMGAACALACARDGADVLVLDGSPVPLSPEDRPSQALLPSTCVPGHRALAERSLFLWSQAAAAAAEEFGFDIGLEASGSLTVALQPDDLEAAARACPDGRRVSRSDLRRDEPALSREVAGALYFDADARLSADRAALAMLRIACRSGAVVRYGHRVRTMSRRRDGGVALHTALGAVFRASEVILTVDGEGQVPGGRPILRGGAPRFLTAPVGPPGLAVPVRLWDSTGTGELSAVPGPDGSVTLVAAPAERDREELGASALVSTRRLAERSVRLLPALAQASLARVDHTRWAVTDDDLGMLGRDPHRPGIWHARAMGRHRTLLAPACGEAMADLVAGRPPVVDVTALAPGRALPSAPSFPAVGPREEAMTRV